MKIKNSRVYTTIYYIAYNICDGVARAYHSKIRLPTTFNIAPDKRHGAPSENGLYVNFSPVQLRVSIGEGLLLECGLLLEVFR